MFIAILDNNSQFNAPRANRYDPLNVRFVNTRGVKPTTMRVSPISDVKKLWGNDSFTHEVP